MLAAAPHGARVAAAAVAALVGVYSWWATALAPFTAPALVAVVGGGLAAMVAGSRWRRPRPAVSASAAAAPAAAGPAAAGLAGWAVLVLVLAGWEVAAWLQHPRAEHPTLSSMANAVLGPHPVRAAAFGTWLMVGARLARRRAGAPGNGSAG